MFWDGAGTYIKPVAQACRVAGAGIRIVAGTVVMAAAGLAYSPDAGDACDDDVHDENPSCTDDKCEKAKREAQGIYNHLVMDRITNYMRAARQGAADDGHHKAITQRQAQLRDALRRVRKYCKPLPTEYEKWERLANQSFPVRH
jgi:hypothetical protein